MDHNVTKSKFVVPDDSDDDSDGNNDTNANSLPLNNPVNLKFKISNTNDLKNEQEKNDLKNKNI